MVPAAEGEVDKANYGLLSQFTSIQQDRLSWSGYERNKFFHNAGGGSFFEVGSALGVDSILDGRGVAYGDLDADGDLDLVISNRNSPHVTILRNDHLGAGHFLAVALEGAGSNWMAIGAQVRVRCDGRQQLRAVTLGDGFVTQSTTTAWFGLGQCETVQSVVIEWPSGTRQALENVRSDQRILVTEGQPGWRSVAVAGI